MQIYGTDFNDQRVSFIQRIEFSNYSKMQFIQLDKDQFIVEKEWFLEDKLINESPIEVKIHFFGNLSEPDFVFKMDKEALYSIFNHSG